MKINMGNDDSSQLSNKTPESITLAKETKESACQSTNPSRNSVTKRKPWSLEGWNNHKTWSISCKRTCKAKPPWQWKKQGKACPSTENFNYLSNLLPAINVTHTCQCLNNRNASEALNWHPKLESAHSDDNLSRLWTVWCNILYNIKTKEWLPKPCKNWGLQIFTKYTHTNSCTFSRSDIVKLQRYTPICAVSWSQSSSSSCFLSLHYYFFLPTLIKIPLINAR